MNFLYFKVRSLFSDSIFFSKAGWIFALFGFGILNLDFVFFASAQECGYIYVTPNGATSGLTGTKANPAKFSFGLSLVSTTNKIIRMAAGTYSFSNAINIPSNVIIEGGFNSSTWVKSNATPTIIYRDSLNNLSNPNRLVGLSCIGVSGFRLLDLTINIADAIGDGVTVYGIYVNNCTNYVISRCKINAGDGSDGNPGTPGIPGMDGDTGKVGQPGVDIGDCCRNGGLGGCCSFPGSYSGGKGGTGAVRGGFVVNVYTGIGCPWDTCYYNKPLSDYTNTGLPGLFGQGYGGVPGGNGGAGVCQSQYYQQQCYSDPAQNDGDVGDPGIDGKDGINGLQGIDSYSGGFYVPDSGSVGTDALPGGGGGGGGGGGAKGCESAVLDPETGDTISYVSGSGAGGGGGGEGGQGGFIGGGGAGAGGSFSIFVWANGINGVVRDCSLNPGQGGQGGNGGVGGAGGQGGAGGKGGNLYNDSTGTHSCNTGVGGKGGAGGTGGKGGDGGKGSDGDSKALYQQPGQEPILLSNMYNPFEPTVTATFSGCSNSDVTFTTNATGNIDWVFGVGANPSTASGANVSVQYDSGIPGFRSITLVVDGVPYPLANFINIPTDFTPPKIKSSKNVVCVGDAVNIFTTETATTYNWSIPGGSITTSSLQTPGNVTFSSPGIKTISLTTTSCCGTSVTTKDIEVITSPTIDIGNDTSMCFTDALPLLDAGNPGATYQWFFNGSPTGDTSHTKQTAEPGLYSVIVSYGSCFNSDSMYLDIYNKLPIDLGTDILLCTGDTLPVLNAGLTGMQSYLWTMNSNPVGMNSQTLQTIGAGTYMVSVTSPTGCIGKDTIILTIKDPEIELGNNITVCSNEPLPVLDGGNSGCTYSWALNGSAAGTSKLLQTTAAGLYSVTVTSPAGCSTSDNLTLNVVPALIAAFTVPASAMVGSFVSVTDNSSPPPTSWNWNFGDGSLNESLQNPIHIYTEAGQYAIFLIVNNGTCSDTITTVINVQNDCSALGLTAAFTQSDDTIYLNGLGMVTLNNTSSNSNSWLWDFGDGQTSTEQNPTHVYADEGTYTITLTSFNYNCSTMVSGFETVMLYPLGISESDNTSGLWKVKILPNPSNGKFFVSLSHPPSEKNTISVLNVLGETVYKSIIPNPGNEIDLSSHPKGIYFFKVVLNKGLGEFEREIIKKVAIN